MHGRVGLPAGTPAGVDASPGEDAEAVEEGGVTGRTDPHACWGSPTQPVRSGRITHYSTTKPRTLGGFAVRRPKVQRTFGRALHLKAGGSDGA
jgi:hypothetical protein